MAGQVVRAGLTPKYKDVDTLTTMLTYQMLSPQARARAVQRALVASADVGCDPARQGSPECSAAQWASGEH